MVRALELADQAGREGEVPVGALVVQDHEIIGEGWNSPIVRHDPTAHAEVCALRAAGETIGNYRLTGASLFVTLEPCVMCLGAIIHARIARVVFAASDPKRGAAGGVMRLLENYPANHLPEVSGGLMAAESGDILREFFRQRR